MNEYLEQIKNVLENAEFNLETYEYEELLQDVINKVENIQMLGEYNE
jgi:hypothetical protein